MVEILWTILIYPRSWLRSQHEMAMEVLGNVIEMPLVGGVHHHYLRLREIRRSETTGWRWRQAGWLHPSILQGGRT